MSQDEQPRALPTPQAADQHPLKIAAVQHFVVTTQLVSPLAYINAQRAAARFPLQTLNQLRADILHHLDAARAKAKTLSASQTILYDTSESDALFRILNALMNQAHDALRKHVDENLNVEDDAPADASSHDPHPHPHEDFDDE